MDRTPEFLSAADIALKTQSISEAQRQQLKSSLLLKPKRKPSAFNAAAALVATNISDLKAFVKTNQHDYVSSGTYRHGDKDKVEAEVGMFVKACTQQVEQLKHSVLAAQQPQQQAPAGAPRPPLSPHVAAHLHGVVLILAEQLHSVTAAFDRCRAERYQQAGELEQWQRKPSRGAFAAGGAEGPPTSSSSKQGVWEQEPGQPLGGLRHSGTAAQQQLQQAGAQTFEQENSGLIAHLNGTSAQMLGLERTLRDIATLNTMLSTAVLHQAHAIEAIYDNAVEATLFVVRGNASLTAAVAVNRSYRHYMLVLLIVASLSLLFYDWANS